MTLRGEQLRRFAETAVALCRALQLPDSLSFLGTRITRQTGASASSCKGQRPAIEDIGRHRQGLEFGRPIRDFLPEKREMIVVAHDAVDRAFEHAAIGHAEILDKQGVTVEAPDVVKTDGDQPTREPRDFLGIVEQGSRLAMDR